MVGIAFWVGVETPTAWLWPYLPVLLVVSAVLAGCWWVLVRREGLQRARVTAMRHRSRPAEYFTSRRLNV